MEDKTVERIEEIWGYRNRAGIIRVERRSRLIKIARKRVNFGSVRLKTADAENLPFENSFERGSPPVEDGKNLCFLRTQYDESSDYSFKRTFCQ